MNLIRTTLCEPPMNAEAAVVIDVCRAFTTAAFAFSAGAEKIFLVKTIVEALVLKLQFPDAVLMGEEKGLPVEGFELWNSPSALLEKDLNGKTLIQRTTSGTRGMVEYKNTPLLLAGSFVNAGATIKYLQRFSPVNIVFVMTGVRSETSGQEDAVCADYFIDNLSGQVKALSHYLDGVGCWSPEKISTQPEILKTLYADLECCRKLDHFDFVMKASIMGDLLILETLTL